MTGRDFLSVAEELANGTAEPHWRSATSRAYYAAYHTARESLEENDIAVLGGPGGHEFVRRCLNNSDDPELTEAAAGLGTLRGSRIKADYKIGPRAFARDQAQLDLGLARIIIRHVDKSQLTRGGAKTVVSAIREYLRTTGQSQT